MENYHKMVDLFEAANEKLLQIDKILFNTQVSERTLCGALMLHLHNIMSTDETLIGYHVDVEYNRNQGGIKTIRKTIVGEQEQIIPINCDLIIHSRGERPEQDNLIAIEMKKSTRPPLEKDKDRERLVALTKDSFNDVWSFDRRNLPEHVCRYILGVYYEINYKKNQIYIEYYKQGQQTHNYILNINA